ncbi:hypothetical protein MLD38_020476 [Melastoma candidum]|nr:hypothetical protein MLD38_020476 [Melastoma candidum]
MWQSDVRPDRVTALTLLSASADFGQLKIGKQCHCYVMRNGLLHSENVGTAIIDMYVKCGKPELARAVFDALLRKPVASWNSLVGGYLRNGNLESARKIFDEMPRRDVVSYNTLIGGFVQETRFDEAIGLFREMQRVGIKPDRITLASIATACGIVGALGVAKWILFYIEHEGIECDVHLFTALIDMFGRCGDPVTAMRVFEKMKRRDPSAWTAIIRAMAASGCGKLAVDLFDKMIQEGYKPDDVTLVGVLTACSHCGLVDEGRRIFRSMEGEHGISPQIIHYGCMVDMLARAGHLEEAMQFIKGMPIEPNDIIWRSLLSACRVHKDDDMASYAASRLEESSPGGTGTAVILSNVYASMGKWSDVRRVRLEMNENGMLKLPGCSSVEINGAIHEFTAGDESHPKIRHIERMLSEIDTRIRDVGYVPNTSDVTLNMDEEEKGVAVGGHSEKLAMAYALISTDKGRNVRVVKNLRTCGDCHGYAKAVSKVYGREIVIRDKARFHFFRDGFCSCNDSW